MARGFSPAVRRELYAQETDEAFLVLLTVSTVPPARFVNNNADITSRGQVFMAYPFELALPFDDDERVAEATIRIDNVSGAITDALRALAAPPAVLIEVVRASVPDDVLLATTGLKLRATQTDNQVIEGKLFVDNVLHLQYPADDYTPAQFPGLFR